METIIKIALAILLFVCLLDMPYGYYQLVRFIALFGFSILAYRSYEKEYKTEMIIYGGFIALISFVILAYKAYNNVKNMEVIIYSGLALLFQPIIKIALGREIWNVVDVIVGIGLILSIFLKNKNGRDI